MGLEHHQVRISWSSQKKDVDSKKKGETKNNGPQSFVASFVNSGNDPFYNNAELYFRETFWSKYGKNDPPFAVNTFDGHEWNFYVDGKHVKG